MNAMTIKLLFKKFRITIFVFLLFWLIACNSSQGRERYKNSDLGFTFLYPSKFDVSGEEIVNRTCSDVSLFKDEYNGHCTTINFSRDDQQIWNVYIETFSNDSLNLKGKEVLNFFISTIEVDFGEENVRVLSDNVNSSSDNLTQTYTTVVNIDQITNQPSLGTWVKQIAVKFIEGENESAIIVGETIAFRDSNDIDPLLQTIIESFQFD